MNEFLREFFLNLILTKSKMYLRLYYNQKFRNSFFIPLWLCFLFFLCINVSNIRRVCLHLYFRFDFTLIWSCAPLELIYSGSDSNLVFSYAVVVGCFSLHLDHWRKETQVGRNRDRKTRHKNRDDGEDYVQTGKHKTKLRVRRGLCRNRDRQPDRRTADSEKRE